MTESLVRLLWFASPGFPTGGFAYSHGLEWAVESGDVRDQSSLKDWLEILLRHGAGWNDSVLLRHAHRAAKAAAPLEGLIEIAVALAPSSELHLESTGQGAAFSAAAAVWGATPVAAHPVAFGAFAPSQNIGEDDCCAAYLAAWTANLVSAGVRLVPLGQMAGLRVMRDLERAIQDVADQSRNATLDDLGSACFRADIASMRHETQYSRMFRS